MQLVNILIVYIYTMKWLPILFFCLLFSFFSFGQKASQIYDKKGRLIADTSYSISKSQLKFLLKFEHDLIKQVNSLIWYPEACRDANLSDKITVSFQINDSGKVSNIALEGKKGKTYSTFFLSVIKHSMEKIEPLSYSLPAEVISKKYFLVFNFQLIENIKNDETCFSSGIFIIKGKKEKIITIE